MCFIFHEYFHSNYSPSLLIIENCSREKRKPDLDRGHGWKKEIPVPRTEKSPIIDYTEINKAGLRHMNTIHKISLPGTTKLERLTAGLKTETRQTALPSLMLLKGTQTLFEKLIF